jgi:hypothetical protein
MKWGKNSEEKVFAADLTTLAAAHITLHLMTA